MLAELRKLSNQQLNEHLQQYSDAHSSRLFVIVDATANPEILQLFRTRDDLECYALFHNTPLEECMPASPYLIAMDDVAKNWLLQVSADKHLDMIWFSSQFDTDFLVQFWRSLVSAKLADGKAAFFRIWNSFVIDRYLQLLPLKEKRQLFFPIQELYCQHKWGNVWNQHRFQMSSKPVALDGIPWWHTKSYQLVSFQSIFEQVLAQHIYYKLWALWPEISATLAPAKARHIVSQSITQARTLGLSSDFGLVTFAKTQIRQGYHFWRHPRWNSVWKNPENKDSHFVELADSVALISE